MTFINHLLLLLSFPTRKKEPNPKRLANNKLYKLTITLIVQSIPRTMTLDKKIGSNLLEWPVAEVQTLTLRSDEFQHFKVKPKKLCHYKLEQMLRLVMLHFIFLFNWIV